VLLQGSDDWLDVESISEGLIRIAETDGTAGRRGFIIHAADGSVVGVQAAAIMGVRVA
jgi:hypothetical protein